MAFVRRVRTASGATAVQIAEYVAGRQRIVAHVGSAHTEAELGVLLERARELLSDPAQGVLFAVEAEPWVTPLARPVEVPGLFDDPRPHVGSAAARVGWCPRIPGCSTTLWPGSTPISGSTCSATRCLLIW